MVVSYNVWLMVAIMKIFKLGFRRHVVNAQRVARDGFHTAPGSATTPPLVRCALCHLMFYTMGALFVFLAVTLSC